MRPSSICMLSAMASPPAQTVPYGVLCFLPSYKMLEKLTKRWQVRYPLAIALSHVAPVRALLSLCV